MLGDVLRTCSLGPLSRVVLVSESASLGTLAQSCGIERLNIPALGMRGAARAALERVSAEGCRHALVLPADLPLLRTADLEALVRAADADVVIAPDRHRIGTNALVLSPPLVLTPRFGGASFTAHRAAARRAGLRTRTVVRRGIAFDIDVDSDLRALAMARGLGERTRAVLSDLRAPR
jgi:2-phospho-L-lactate guanylyltransferase